MSQVHELVSVSLTWQRRPNTSGERTLGEYSLQYLCQCGKSLGSRSVSAVTFLEELVLWAETSMSAVHLVSSQPHDHEPSQGKCSSSSMSSTGS